MSDEPKIVARAVFQPRPGCRYSLAGCDVWEQEIRPGTEVEAVKVASAQFTRRPGHVYLLDGEGNIRELVMPQLAPPRGEDDLAQARERRSLQSFLGTVKRLLRRRPEEE